MVNITTYVVIMHDDDVERYAHTVFGVFNTAKAALEATIAHFEEVRANLNKPPLRPYRLDSVLVDVEEEYPDVTWVDDLDLNDGFNFSITKTVLQEETRG